jgi:hypothetical protein
MNDRIEHQLRTAHRNRPAPAGFTDRLRDAVRDEPQVPDRHGFEMRRVGPIAAAVLIGCALIPFIVGPPVDDRRALNTPQLNIDAPLDTLAQTVNSTYAQEFRLLRSDVTQISASALRSWRPLARN